MMGGSFDKQVFNFSYIKQQSFLGQYKDPNSSVPFETQCGGEAESFTYDHATYFIIIYMV